MLDAKRTFLLPKISDRDPAGRLIMTPGIVEAAATNPIKTSGVPKLSAKGFRTGFLDIVELRMANAPITHRTRKKPWRSALAGLVEAASPIIVFS